MSETIDLDGIGDGIPLLSFDITDPHGGFFTFHKTVDGHSPAMFTASTTGQHIDRVVLHTPAMTYTFRDCLLSSYSVHDDTEHWTVTYVTIELTTADGQSDAEYDRAEPAPHVELHIEPAPVDEAVPEA